MTQGGRTSKRRGKAREMRDSYGLAGEEKGCTKGGLNADAAWFCKTLIKRLESDRPQIRSNFIVKESVSYLLAVYLLKVLFPQ